LNGDNLENTIPSFFGPNPLISGDPAKEMFGKSLESKFPLSSNTLILLRSQNADLPNPWPIPDIPSFSQIAAGPCVAARAAPY